ncbi:hypothetical protein NERG_02646, partial [Nematocida ausubeli]
VCAHISLINSLINLLIHSYTAIWALLSIYLSLCVLLSISLDFPWHTLYTARVLSVCAFPDLPAFPVPACSFSYFSLFSLCLYREHLNIFIIFIISPVYTDTHSQYTHTCLSYKLAHMLAYTLLSGTFVLYLSLCAHLSIPPEFPLYTLYTARVLSVCTLLGVLVFFGFGLYFLCFPCVYRTLEYFYYIFIRAIQTYTPSVHTCLL